MVVPSAGRPSAVARAADSAAFASHGASVVSSPGRATVDVSPSFRLVKKNTPAATAIVIPTIHAS
jgi:hypothetical protein